MSGKCVGFDMVRLDLIGYFFVKKNRLGIFKSSKNGVARILFFLYIYMLTLCSNLISYNYINFKVVHKLDY